VFVIIKLNVSKFEDHPEVEP